MPRALALFLALALPFAASPLPAQPAGDALYRVEFRATWSADTHPDMFPSNAHFSWLIGGTHGDQVDFWTPGATASLGIERMAEWGSTQFLAAEVEAAIGDGHAGQVIESEEYPPSPGATFTDFTATPDAPLVTLTSMVAPSPDWFVGVRGLDLRDGDAWAPSLTVDLFPWDAGTDSGVAFTSPDQDTDPREPISAITGAPFSPGVPLGTFTFTLLSSSTGIPSAPSLEASAHPSPFNPRTTVGFTAPGSGPVDITVHDPRGRRVRTLLAGTVAAGRHERTWDGRDDDGAPMPAGLYLVRVRHGRDAAVLRVVLAK